MWTRQRSPDAGAVPARPLVLDEASARAVVLVQAVETTDLQGRIVGTPERDQAEQEAVEAVRDPAHPHTPDPARYLAARAQRLLDIVALRQPAIAQLREPPPWRAWFTYALPAAGFLAGALVDRIGNPRALDLVSPTLLAFIGWNLVVYLLLAVSAFLPRRDRATKWPWGIRASAHASAAQAFHTLWWRVAGPLESRRLQQVLHLAAAAWALGICVSIAAGGLFREYRVGWESTWLGAPQVHAVVSALTAVPQLLLPVEGFTLADIERLRNSPSVGPQEGRRWVLLYVTLLIVLVVVPRLLLALYAASRARLGRRIAVDLSQPYFLEVLGRVSPARVVVGFAPHPMLQTLLRQAADISSILLGQPGTEGEPRRAIHTSRGDELLLTTDTRVAQQVWAVGSSADATLRFVPAHEAEDAATSGSGPVAPQRLVLPPCWVAEQALHDAFVAAVPSHERGGAQRIVQRWRDAHLSRFEAATQVMSQALLESAQDREEVQGSRVGGGKAREAAMATMMQRVEERLARAAARLRALHHLDDAQALGASRSGVARTGDPAMPDPRSVGAGLAAGAAAGALAGAKIDLLTGGLTMGAGAAVGALIGSAGVFGAGKWIDLGSLGGKREVSLSDEQLLSLVEAMVVQYVAVIHAGRFDAGEHDLARWRSEAVARVALMEQDFARLWKRVRTGGDGLQAETAALLKTSCREVLNTLYPESRPILYG